MADGTGAQEGDAGDRDGADPARAPAPDWPRGGRFWPRPLVVVLGTFHLLAVSLLVLVPAYASGGLSDALPSLGTLPGLALFALLWGLTLAATNWALATDALGPDLRPDASSVVLRGTVAGALVGMSTVGGVFLLLLGQSLLSGPTPEPLSVVLIVLFALSGGALGGLIVGLGVSLLDLLVLWLTRLVIPLAGEAAGSHEGKSAERVPVTPDADGPE